MSTLVPSFEFKLGSPICPGMVCAGKFDGAYPSLAAATPNGNVLLHDPRASANAIRTLSFGRSVRGLSCVPGAALVARKQQQYPARADSNDSGNRDVLLLGGDTCAHVFDVHTNSDAFFKDVPDGACCCAMGMMSIEAASSSSSSSSEPVIVVGSNCSIQGYTHDGTECFWTVSGDSVTCITFAYLNTTFMLVGSKDCFVRVYSGEQLLHEISETAAPTCLKVVPKTSSSSSSSSTQFDACTWVYALENGTIGVYAPPLFPHRKNVTLCSATWARSVCGA